MLQRTPTIADRPPALERDVLAGAGHADDVVGPRDLLRGRTAVPGVGLEHVDEPSVVRCDRSCVIRIACPPEVLRPCVTAISMCLEKSTRGRVALGSARFQNVFQRLCAVNVNSSRRDS